MVNRFSNDNTNWNMFMRPTTYFLETKRQFFCGAMLYIHVSAVYAVVRLSVCHVRVEDLRPHSIILASCKPGCKPGFRPGLQPGFRQVRAGLRHAFGALSTFFVENLVANLLYQSRHVEIDAAGSLVRARARQFECRKKQFRASQRTCWSWIFVTYFIIRAYRDVIQWKNAMKKFDFTPKNVINCVHNVPTLWDTECTDVHPEITVRIDSYHRLPFLEA